MDLASRIASLPLNAHLAWVFPGQGAQSVGMAKELVEAYPAARAVFEAADAALGTPISTICFEGPEAELTRTVNTQPAIVTHSIAALTVALETGAVTERPAFTAGHSLGEYAALIASGALPFEEGLRLVRDRGRFMQEACDREPGTLAAVLGLEPEAVRQVCARTETYVCNINAPGNITIGGTVTAIEAASAAAAEAGAVKVVPLAVSGAFHTPLMNSAAKSMRARLAGVAFAAPRIPIVSNVTTRPLTEAGALAEELETQIVSPVLWSDSVIVMRDAGVSEMIEFGPGRVLTTLLRRIDRGIAPRNIDTAADVDVAAS